MIKDYVKKKIPRGYKEAVADAVYAYEIHVQKMLCRSKRHAWEVCNSINLLSNSTFTPEQWPNGSWYIRKR